MTLDQIAGLAVTSESETLEFKETIGTRREAAWTVCILLNQLRGQVLFGVMHDSGLGNRPANTPSRNGVGVRVVLATQG